MEETERSGKLAWRTPHFVLCCATSCKSSRSSSGSHCLIFSCFIEFSFFTCLVFPGAVSLKTKMDALLKSFVNKVHVHVTSDTTSCDGGEAVAKHLIQSYHRGHLSRHRGKHSVH